jgi:hypothetical protein
MYADQSEEFKKYFLLKFTKQLIRNSASMEIYKLTEMLKQQEEGIKKQEIESKRKIKAFVKKRIKKNEEYTLSVKQGEEENLILKTDYGKGVIKKDISARKTLFIPEPMLPERLQYLRPIPTLGEIDLGKLNSFIQDPVVRIIECNGPDQGIVISGTMGKKETSVTLTKEEIEEIIKKFSEETKIPLQEGFFKVALNKLIISAIYSESVGSKFIIKKCFIPPHQKIYP